MEVLCNGLAFANLILLSSPLDSFLRLSFRSSIVPKFRQACLDLVSTHPACTRVDGLFEVVDISLRNQVAGS
jgi:hypothetical protein